MPPRSLILPWFCHFARAVACAEGRGCLGGAVGAVSLARPPLPVSVPGSRLFRNVTGAKHVGRAYPGKKFGFIWPGKLVN